MSDIDTAAADGLKVLDLKRPIREANLGRSISLSWDLNKSCRRFADRPEAVIAALSQAAV